MWRVKDWPLLKSALVGETKVICNTLWGSVDLSTRLGDSYRNLHNKGVSRLAWPCVRPLATVAMQMGTTVTHWNGDRKRDLSRCKKKYTNAFSID